MSNIDQAFINAYSDQSAVGPTTVPRSKVSSMHDAANAPALRVFSHNTDRADARFDKSEAVGQVPRAPHFSATVEDPYVAIARQQQAAYPQEEELTLPSRMGDRKPLSAFAVPRQAPNAAFRPVFEVDEFRWPLITSELLSSYKSYLQPVVDTLVAAVTQGRSLVGIAGTTSGVGTTTVTMCVARALAELGYSMALVDANFAVANLASSLGLEFDAGWEQVLLGQVPLAECAVVSLADKMTLIPLGTQSTEVIDRLTSIQSSVIAGMLRYHHDIVLFDLGSATQAKQLTTIQSIVEHCRLDAGIIVSPTGAKDLDTLHSIDKLTTLFGSLCMGLIGNRAL